jgi:hypothetical protein
LIHPVCAAVINAEMCSSAICCSTCSHAIRRLLMGL